MTAELNETHDPSRRSWLESANDPASDFPIQNLPFAALRPAGSSEPFRIAVAIGDQALDLTALAASGTRPSPALEACVGATLNAFMALGPSAWHALRVDLVALLEQGASEQAAVERCLLPLDSVEYALPATVGDFTDFYASIYHASNIGALFRPDDPLLPNYRWIPIGYHGRSSSLAISGQSFPRPKGQLKGPDNDRPRLAPSARMDYELEVGIFVGPGNTLGSPVSIEQAEDHIFGLCLLNDWSARDIQAWEYQPLGPFLAKNFASTLSPWVVTNEALAPFRVPFVRDAGEPAPLPYLQSATSADKGAVNLDLEVLIQTAKMQAEALPPERLSRSNFRTAYWTMAQMLTHHSVNGCNLQPGDLLGSGTMSGPDAGSEGALIELTRGGREPLSLGNGEQRTFLEDGDRIILRGHCAAEGARRIGFGECVGTVLPAVAD